MMAIGIIQFVLLSIASLLVPYLIRGIKRQNTIDRRGCRAPRRYPQAPLRFGTDFANLQLQKQTKESYKAFLRGLFDEHGRTFAVTVLGREWLFTCAPENIQAINTSLASNFVVAPFRKLPVKCWIGDGMFVSDGEKWKTSRALFKPMFGRVAISQLSAFDKHVERFLELIPGDGATFDMQPLLKHLYLDASTELIFGRSANCQNPEDALFDVERFEVDFATAMSGYFTRMHSRAAAWFARDDKSWLRACNDIHRIFDKEIDRTLLEKNRQGKDADSPKSMVAELSRLSESRLFIRDQLLNVFIGAKDTAGVGIADVFFHLVRHPQVWTKLRAEVLQIEAGAPITFELLKSLKYMQAVITESIRLLSPVTISLRSATQDCILPVGGGPDGRSPVFVSKGTKIEVSISSLHLDTEIWGPDASVFRPDRWTDGLLVKWEYVPFLGGARMCPAQQMMLTQYAFILVRFAQRFRTIECRDPVKEFVPQIIFSQESENGVKMAAYGA